MTRPGWQSFAIVATVLVVLSAGLGIDALSGVFFLLGLTSIGVLIRTASRRRPRAKRVWYVFAAAIGLFLVGGIAEVATTPADPANATYPGWRELFDFTAYVAVVYATGRMAKARLANRDSTITLDALIGMGGVGSLAWVTVMATYLETETLTPLGKMTGIAFTMISLTVGFNVVRLAIGPGARPPAYYFLAVAVAGSFASEIFIELELSGRTIAGSEMASTIASALGVVALTASALHPSMAELTEPPAEVTPKMTGRRLVLMTVAVLIPPALLLVETSRSNQWETAAIVALWAALSIMVMFRVFSLARTRERFSEVDSALATADAALAAASDRNAMIEPVLEAAAEIVSDVDAVAVHAWEDGHWMLLGGRGRVGDGPRAESPLPSLTQDPLLDGERYRLDVHFEAVDVLTGVVTVNARRTPDPFEVGRFASLVDDLARTLESAALREQLGRERSERRFRALVDNSADMIMVIDDDRFVRYASPAGSRLLAIAEEDLLERRLSDFVVTEHRDQFERLFEDLRDDPIEIELVGADGTRRWFAVLASDMRHDAEIEGLVVTASEISARKQAQLDLQRNEARFRSLVQHASDLVMVVGADGAVSWASPSTASILNRSASDVLDRSVIGLVHPDDRHGLETALEEVAVEGGVPIDAEVRFERVGGGPRLLEMRATNLLADPSVAGIVLNAHDVTERQMLEQSLRHQALHDDLTGLPNRVLLRQRLGESLAATDGTTVVMVIDLDDFKTVNDGLGHSMGDDILNVLATRLVSSVRSTDVVARLGGDEFAVLIEDATDRSKVTNLAQRLLTEIQKPILVSGRDIEVHASIGVVFASDVGRATPETMLRDADLAMYGAKNRGKSRVTIFDESMHEGAFERLELKADLVRALEREELLLHYQPVVDLASGEIAGFEALMRWRHSERGMVGPNTFIPLAEETGLIVPIGRWLADVALAQLRVWQDRFPSPTPLTMNINVSGRQLEDEDIVADIAGAIERAGVDPACVMIELTESVVVEDSPDLVRRLNEIRSIGVGLYADDFGAGFASYSALQSLPFTGVKIDRSLVDGLDGPASDRAMAQVRSIIEMSATTDMAVVAEGIETSAQAEALVQLRCDKAQGYYFCRPQPVGEMDAKLAKGRSSATISST